jgi:hypothetical protein
MNENGAERDEKKSGIDCGRWTLRVVGKVLAVSLLTGSRVLSEERVLCVCFPVKRRC